MYLQYLLVFASTQLTLKSYGCGRGIEQGNFRGNAPLGCQAVTNRKLKPSPILSLSYPLTRGGGRLEPLANPRSGSFAPANGRPALPV